MEKVTKGRSILIHNASFVQRIDIKQTRELVPSQEQPVLEWFLESSFLQKVFLSR